MSEAERVAAGRYLCAGCGRPAQLPARTKCKCETNVLFDPTGTWPDAIKDSYFISQIDTAGDRWPELKAQMEANRQSVATILKGQSDG